MHDQINVRQIRLCLGQRGIDGGGKVGQRDLGRKRDRVGDKLAAGQAHSGAHQVGRRDFRCSVHAQRRGQPAIARPEAGERILPVGDHRHAEGFQHLQRFRQIEDGLGAGRNHGDGGFRQLAEVGRDVKAEFGTTMHATDAAGGKDVNASQPCRDHGGGDGGSAGFAHGDAGGKIRAREFQRVMRLAEGGEFRRGQPDVQLALQHGDGGGRGAVVAHLGLDLGCGVNVLRPRHTVGDNGGFKRHNRGAICARAAHFIGQDKFHRGSPLPSVARGMTRRARRIKGAVPRGIECKGRRAYLK
ncbi:hypothetical protein GALL_460360 [mine drainage metagenome]|uniref:Uncharacterized protein n=1 Tax=mine drainage metagenome TaxID=410659 RepID=A0A1J5PMF7_9ZZZZ